MNEQGTEPRGVSRAGNGTGTVKIVTMGPGTSAYPGARTMRSTAILARR
jgi:hypothetical protein